MTPLRILQGAGNSLDTLPLVRHDAVDGISADVYVHDGEVFAQAPPTVTRQVLTSLPVLGARIAARTQVPVIVPVVEVFRAADEYMLLIDVRSTRGDPVPDIAVMLHPVPDRSRLLVACESWDVAERLHAWLPDLSVALSLNTEGALRQYIQARMGGSIGAAPVIVRESLLHTADEVASLRKRATFIGARSVASSDRARALAAWGIDLVASESVGVLAALES